MKIKALLISLLVLVASLVYFPLSTRAIECGEDLPTAENDLRIYEASCKDKIIALQNEQQTLKSAIALITSKISLTQAQIRNTNVQIEQLIKEIDTLGTVITNLNQELDSLSKVYVSRLRESYKTRTTDPVLLFLSSGSYANFQSQLKYLRTTQKRDQILLRELESARINYDEEKTTKEDKQAEVEDLKATLESQKQVLGAQQTQKNQLLEETKNSEKNYQSLLQEAQKQLAAFRRFVLDQGGASILDNQTSCNDWGCYYNQRDSQWANQLIGLSSETMKEVGCLITSMAMVATHYGKSLTPGQIAASSTPFWSTTAYMNQGSWSVNGVTMNRTRVGYSSSALDSELASGNPVIVGIYGGPDHFIVIKKKEGEDYIMNDPFVENGHDIKFTDKYPLSAISAVDRVTVN